MSVMITPAQFHSLKKEVDQLINAYQSVNDPKTIMAVQGLTIEKINEIAETTEFIRELCEFILDKSLTKARAEQYFESFKEHVQPFKIPTSQQIAKVFRKVKKLKVPSWEMFDLREQSFLGWNDAGSQKKYLLCYQEERLVGLSGQLSPNNLKNVCSICNHTSNVALFLATTKTSGDGTYTKKGNYICVDSHTCNQQLLNIEQLHQFVTKIR
ncbi:MAG: FusB/FusC family EF-G-binding protein [Enterococcus sp.]